MKKSLPFLLLVFFVMGCGLFGGRTDTASKAVPAGNAAPAAPVQAVDLPSLVGKSRDEAKKIVGVTPKNENPWLEWNLPQGDLTIQYDKEKPGSISFSMKPISVGDRSISGFRTAEEFGKMVGIDVSGKAPKSTSESFHTYEESIQGKTLEITFNKIGDTFSGVMVDLPYSARQGAKK